jgi:short-subunit dehydrogenase
VTNYLVFGASRGLGALFARELPVAGDQVWLVARSQPDLSEGDGVRRHWIPADLSTAGAGRKITEALGDVTLDVCIYNAGIWETHAFTEQYDYEQVSDEETERLITINLTSAITSVQKLLPHLRRSTNGKIIFIGAYSGLENTRSLEVANTASKFGLRGMTHALREVVRRDRIGVSCINLGNVGVITYENGQRQLEPIEEGVLAITPEDLLTVVRTIVRISNASCIKEIDLTGMDDPV